MADFPKEWEMDRSKPLSSYIAALEALAQWILMDLRLQRRLSHVIELRQMCDNIGAVCAIEKFFSTKAPLSHVLQGVAFTCAMHGVVLNVAHRSGKRNVWADALSRLQSSEHAEFELLLDRNKQQTACLGNVLNQPWKEPSRAYRRLLPQPRP